MATATAVRAENLTGAQKGAVLFMTLGTEVSAKVMQSLSQDEQESISRAIANTPSVGTAAVSRVLSEFVDVARAVESISQGGVDYARGVLEQAVGPARAKEILDRIQDRRVQLGLKGLKKAPTDLLMTVLRGEHPQTIALILAHLEVRQSAGLIESMDTDLAADVLYRVARMEKVAPEMLEMIEKGLASKADLSLTQEMTLSGGPQAVANVLNFTTGTLEKSLIASIGERNDEHAGQIKNYMFVFEDLRLLDGRSMQRVLRDVDGKELALALKAATDELKDHILGNMSERAGAALSEELEFMGPVRVKDVEAAQSKIIQSVRALEEAGEIVVAGRGGDEDVID
jgi:flagellar motor switch protein FliG